MILCLLFSITGHLLESELEADLEERKKRNTTGNRLAHKPTKRDVKWSEAELIKTYEKHRLNSMPGEITKPNYMRINTIGLEADQAAELIKKEFNL